MTLVLLRCVFNMVCANFGPQTVISAGFPD